MEKSARGFTLIEILVVIAIMAMIGIFTLSNYKSFGEDQSLKSAVLDLQSQLRTAQTNATTNVKCNTEYSSTWQVEFITNTTTKLRCQESAASYYKKTLELDTNIKIDSVTGTLANCPTATPFTVSFAPLSGNMVFGGVNCISLTITLKNTKTNNTKAITVEKGGKVYVQ